MLVVTGAFLAERAGAIDANLCVWGGVLDTVQVDEDMGVFAKLVILVQRPTYEDRLGSMEEAFTVDIRRPDGTVDRRIYRFSAQVPPRRRNGFYWGDVLFNGAEKGIYTFNIRPGAGADEEDSFFSALEAQEIFESIPPPETSFEVEVRHDRFDLRKATQDDGPSAPV